MTKQQIITMLKPLIIIEVVILVGLGLVCFFGGGRSIEEYSTALLFGGALLFGASPLSLSLSNQNHLMSNVYHPGQTAQLIERSRESRLQQSSSLPGFVQLLMIDGVFTAGVGLLLQLIVG